MELVVSGAEKMIGREAVVALVERLAEEIDGGAEWENATLPRYLESLAALLGSVDRTYINAGEQVPDNPWELVARSLEGARFYE